MQIDLKVLHFENIASFVGNTDLSYLPSLNLSMQIPIFTSPGLSLIRVMTMTAGGVDFDSIFASMNSEPFLTYLLWVVFLVLMPVLLANLLVSKSSCCLAMLFGLIPKSSLTDWIGCW